MKMRVGRGILFLCLAMIAVLPLWSSPPTTELTASPGLQVPTGPTLEDGTQFYGIGYGAALSGRVSLPFAPRFSASLHLDMDQLPITSADTSLTLVSFGPGVGYSLPLSSRLSFRAGGYGGIYIGTIEEGSVRNPFVAAGAHLEYLLNPSLPLMLGADYKVHFTPDEPVYTGISVSLGAAYRFGGGVESVEFKARPELAPVYPLFYTYYDTNPIGTVTLENDRAAELQDVKISFYSKQYMDNPKEAVHFKTFPGNEERQVPLYALFNDSIMEITEATKVSGEIIGEYSYLGREMTQRIPVTVRIQDRNAMTWDDDRKAAAFVTPKDPLVQSFSKHVAAVVRRNNEPTVNETFRTALGIFEALATHGMTYVIDPSSPYEELSQKSDAVDYLQFPNQSLVYRAGDCDDLSILYAALLESVGIETAFITVPGHIFIAFDLQMSEERATKTFILPDDLVFIDGRTWVPMEVTVVGEGFSRAWYEGAKQWREFSPSGKAEFIPVRAAWADYEPVGFREEGAVISLPPEDEVTELYTRELRRFSTRQVEPRVAELSKKIRSSGYAALYINRLGVLYARFGMLDQARAEFERALRRENYVPSILNLGNIAIIRGDYREALQLYRRALNEEPENPGALAGFARANYELEEYSEAREAISALEEVSPETAERYAFFKTDSSTGRASAQIHKEAHEWEE